MLKSFIYILSLLVPCFSYSQNLIENGSFEEVTQIPDFAGQIRYAKGWNNMTHPWNNAVGGSSDLYSTLGGFFTPRGITNQFRMNNSPQDGRNFAGISPYYPIYDLNISLSEYIQYIFPKSLEANVKYRLSYYYTNGVIESNSVNIVAINCITAHFTKQILDHLDETALFIPNTSIKQEAILNSLQTWSKVEHEFVLTEPAICMSFGNFCTQEQLKVDTVAKWDPKSIYSKETINSYYLFDNFVLEKVRQPLDAQKKYVICEGDEVKMSVFGDDNIKWYNSKKQLIAQNIPTLTQSPENTTTYTVVGVTDSVEIEVIVQKKPVMSYVDTLLCLEDIYTFLPAQKYKYDTLIVAPPVKDFQIKEEGKYQFLYQNGTCVIKDTIKISKRDCTSELLYPNVFTPNGDGKNDDFLPIQIKNIASGVFTVYNRWGKEVYKTDNLFLPWNGENLQNGVYFYSCQYKDIKGIETTINGWIEIII